MSAFQRFVQDHVLTLPRPQRWRALSDLAAVAQEARALERRRLTTDPRALEAAHRLTASEIARHAVPQEQGA